MHYYCFKRQNEFKLRLSLLYPCYRQCETRVLPLIHIYIKLNIKLSDPNWLAVKKNTEQQSTQHFDKINTTILTSKYLLRLERQTQRHHSLRKTNEFTDGVKQEYRYCRREIGGRGKKEETIRTHCTSYIKVLLREMQCGFFMRKEILLEKGTQTRSKAIPPWTYYKVYETQLHPILPSTF